MKRILMLVAVGLAYLALPISGDESEDNQAIMEQLLAVVSECRKSYPDVPDERVRLLLKHESSPKNKDERCLSGCVITRGGLVTDGRINVDAWRKMCNAKWFDKTMAQKAGDSAAYCYKRDGRINVDAWRKMCNAKWFDKTMAQKAGDSAAYCYKRVPAIKDTCRLGGRILNCIFSRDKQTGVTPADLPQ